MPSCWMLRLSRGDVDGLVAVEHAGSSGVVKIAPIQKRSEKSRSSGFSSDAAVTMRGSRAMPQIGHAPGSERTISGCIGQVYSVRVAATGISGSKAMPHEGHAPGFASRTSRHIGQT